MDCAKCSRPGARNVEPMMPLFDGGWAPAAAMALCVECERVLDARAQAVARYYAEGRHEPGRRLPGACVDCGAPGTAVREWTHEGRVVARVRRCGGCAQGVERWRADVHSRRAERQAAVASSASSSALEHAPEHAEPIRPAGSRAALVAALDELAAV